MEGTLSFFAIPTLSDCVTRTRLAFRAYLRGTDAWLWPNNIGPTAKVVGGSASEIFERLDYVGRQAFALYAENQYLEDHGADYNIVRKPAAPAGGTVLVTSSDVLIAANGAQLQRGDGVIVTAATGGALSAPGTLALTVLANTKALATNTQPGTSFTLLSGFSGAGAPGATAVADPNGLTGGLDVEPDGPPRSRDLGTLRGRILFRKSNPPQGGAPSDYVQWALSVPGVTRVYVERVYNGPGTVRVFPLFDALFASAGGVADQAHITLVQDAIAALAPAAAAVTVVAPLAAPIPVTVQGLQPNTTAVQQAVLAELQDSVQRLGRVAGNDPATPAIAAALPFLAVPASFAALWIDQAVANAAGDQRGVVVTPTADVVVPVASIPVLGPVTFT